MGCFMKNKWKTLSQLLIIVGALYEIPMNTFAAADNPEDVSAEDFVEDDAYMVDAERMKSRAALYADGSIDARTTIFLRDMKRFLNGGGGEISDLAYRGQVLADAHFADGEYVIGQELDDLVEIVALGEDATPECWDTADRLIDLPH
jgi:hypothetical protein